MKRLSHYEVYVRLKPSFVVGGGVGVFAIKEIPEGKNICYGDKEPFRKVKKKLLEKFNLTEEEKKLYYDFCILEDGVYYCPRNFNVLTVGWYINHSKNPNTKFDEKSGGFITLRKILKGEEIFSDYESYSENEKDNFCQQD